METEEPAPPLMILSISRATGWFSRPSAAPERDPSDSQILLLGDLTY